MDFRNFEVQLSSIKPNSLDIGESGELGNYIKELKDDYDKELSSILTRLHLLEEKQDNINQAAEQNKNKIVALQKSYQDLDKLQFADTRLNSPRSDIDDAPLGKKALDEINKSIQDRMDDLNEKFDQKANLDDMLKEFNVLKESIISLNARKHVDPASHAAHGKEIEELDDRITRMERYGGDIEYLNSKSDDVSKALKTNEELIYKVLAEIGDKANLKEVSDLTTKVSHTQNNINKIINHLNEVQKQIDKIQDDSGPDYSKMINAIEKRLETIQDAFNQRMYDNEKNINRLEEDVGEFKKMADKTDIGLIKLIQQVDSIQIKLDLLDQAFNGFMVPSGLLHGNQDNSLYDALRESIASLRREYFKFKDEAGANFALIGETLSKNADKHDLKDLENRLQEKIDSNEKSTIKNKSEFRRILKDIEDKVWLFINCFRLNEVEEAQVLEDEV